MPTRAQVCTWIAGCVMAAPLVASAQDRSEREIVDLVLREGPQARAIRAGTEVVRRDAAARLAYPNPTVAYSREGAGFAEFLEVEQAVPFFGARASMARSGEAAVDAAEAARDARLWLLRADAAAALARMASAQARVEVTEAYTSYVSRLIDILRTREVEGEGSTFDRLRGEQELREARQGQTAAAVALAEARGVVGGLLPEGVSPGRILPGPSPVQASMPADGLVARALLSRGELRALQRSAERAGHEGDAARRSRMLSPVLSGGLKRGEGETGRSAGAVFGARVVLPLFDTGATQRARWTAERVRVAADLDALESRIRGEVLGAAEALSLRLALIADETDAAGDLTEIAEVAYQEGEIGIVELLDAVRTSSRARIRGLELRLDARLAQIALERAVGEVLWP